MDEICSIRKRWPSSGFITFPSVAEPLPRAKSGRPDQLVSAFDCARCAARMAQRAAVCRFDLAAVARFDPSDCARSRLQQRAFLWRVTELNSARFLDRTT